MSRAGLLESRVGRAVSGPSYRELLLDATSRHGGAGLGNEIPQAALLRKLTSWFESLPDSSIKPSPDRRADLIAMHRGRAVAVEIKTYSRDLPSRSLIAEWRREADLVSSRALFERVEEFVGRVREVDVTARTFTAILGGRFADPSDEVVGTFDRRLVGDLAFDQLRPGSTFTLVTGYQIHLDTQGNAESSSLATRVIMHRARPRSRGRRAAAARQASDLLED